MLLVPPPVLAAMVFRLALGGRCALRTGRKAARGGQGLQHCDGVGSSNFKWTIALADVLANEGEVGAEGVLVAAILDDTIEATETSWMSW